jgi:hypothetical protein
MDPVFRVKRIADNTRKWAEKYRLKHRMGFSETLAGMCGLASYELFKRLERAGLQPTYCLTNNHAYIKCQGRIVDITATQFHNGHEPVTIKPTRGNQGSYCYWRSPRHLKTALGIQRALKRNGWPDWQVHPDIREAVCNAKA